MNGIRLIKLWARNFKKLTAVYIEPSPYGEEIGGKNNVGKSAVLDIARALMEGAKVIGGKKSAILDPLRHGAEDGQIGCELSNGLTLRRYLRPGGVGGLIIEARDGAQYKSPQAIVDKITGGNALGFDPGAILTMDGDEFSRYFREAMGLNFQSIDEEIKVLTSERRDINRDLKKLQGAISQMPEAEGALEQPYNMSELMANLENTIEFNNNLKASNGEIASRAKKLAELKEQREEIEKHISELQHRQVAEAKQIHGLEFRDEAPIREKIANAEKVNELFRQAAQREAAIEEAVELERQSSERTTRLEQLKEAKNAEFAEAMKDFPIEGMGINEGGLVTLDGIPFRKGQTSDSEALKVAVALWRALNPWLKLMLIDRGELLDSANRDEILNLAVEYDFQPLLAVVDESDRPSITIVDGHVKGQNVDEIAKKLDGEEK